VNVAFLAFDAGPRSLVADAERLAKIVLARMPTSVVFSVALVESKLTRYLGSSLQSRAGTAGSRAHLLETGQLSSTRDHFSYQ